MNFFHFDGAEMTLRHITLKGVRSHLHMFRKTESHNLKDNWLAKDV